MKVVICDDNIQDLSKIKNMLLKYKKLHTKVEFEMEKYTDAVKLYDKIQKKELADIYILDMIMSEKTGIDIGNQLRRAGSESVIIYITSSSDFALDAYGVHAVRYLLKPVVEDSFFEAVDFAMSYERVKTEPVYLLKTKDGLASLTYSRIEYIENSSRHLEVYLTGGEIVRSIFIRKSFDEEIEELLCDQSFIKVHKSFMINLKHVRQLAADSAIMESGRNIPISRARTMEVKREYLLYVAEHYR